MAHKSGLSHGFAALVSLVLGAVLLEYIKPAFPEAIETADSIAASITELLESTFGVAIAPDLFPPDQRQL